MLPAEAVDVKEHCLLVNDVVVHVDREKNEVPIVLMFSALDPAR